MLPPAPECRYCGNDHDVRDLCRARRVSRRIFVFTASAAAIGACLPASAGVPDSAYTRFLALRDAELHAAGIHTTWRLVHAPDGTWIALRRAL